MQSEEIASFIDSKIKKNKKTNKDDALLNGIFYILLKLKGHNLQDVLNMYITQFYVLIELLSELAKEEEREMKKARKK